MLSFSIHSPLAGRDCAKAIRPWGLNSFQSTRPLRGETQSNLPARPAHLLFNPLAPCGARLAVYAVDRSAYDFSIHSPLAGRDSEFDNIFVSFSVFNPLAPCGARPRRIKCIVDDLSFQSTRPLRGETRFPRCWACLQCGIFNPLAPCGARQGRKVAVVGPVSVFQSTRPLRGETLRKNAFSTKMQFSIHSPLAGRDPSFLPVNSHVPGFQSTRPLRGETAISP